MLGYDSSVTVALGMPYIHARSPAAMVAQAGILGTLLIVYFTAIAVRKGCASFRCYAIASAHET
jgi:hypothetical protein